MNPGFGGPYIYDKQLSRTGYAVKATENIDLLFDLEGEPIGQLAKIDEKLKARFDGKRAWNGYVVRANEDVSLTYNQSGQLDGQIT